MPGPGQLNRFGLIAAAKAKAIAAGVDLSKFYGVVVTMNTPTDLFGVLGGQAAVCDAGSLQPTVLAQEMGHGYGLQHSRVDGSTTDYQDPWDTMSTWDGCYYRADPNYTLIGPGLCAANMRIMGWLDESRVWKATAVSFSQQIIVRPLHSRSLPGHLAAEMPDGFLVEFRVSEDWDSGFPRAAVFVHRIDDGRSYRMLGSSGSSDLVAGDSFTWGSSLGLYAPFTSVQVDEINGVEHFAKLTLTYRPAQKDPVIVGEVYGGVARGGGGFIVVNGHPHPVDPHGPLSEVTQQVVAHQTANLIAEPLVRLAAKRSALTRIVQVASRELTELTELESPPPATRTVAGIELEKFR